MNQLFSFNLLTIVDNIFFAKGLIKKYFLVPLKCLGHSGLLCVWGLTFERAAVELLFSFYNKLKVSVLLSIAVD